MKAKKMASVILVAMCLMGLMTVNSHAAVSTFVCTVDYAGANYQTINQDTLTVIHLTYVSGTPTPTIRTKNFVVPSTADTREFLAVALTALASGQQVTAQVDFDGANSGVYRLYLMPPTP